jgi:molecular chaperone DnaK (HSP70)
MSDDLKDKLIIGIDLGTTKSAVSVWDQKSGRLQILNNAQGKDLTPSVVAWDRAKSQWVVGEEARKFFESRPSDVVYSIKRFIGRW